jgi:hypothetical protein
MQVCVDNATEVHYRASEVESDKLQFVVRAR